MAEAVAGSPKRRRTIRIWLTLLVVGGLLELAFLLSAFAGKGLGSKNPPLPPSWYEQKYAVLIPAGVKVVGLYHHKDGNADIFRYFMPADQRPNWSASVAASAEAEGWRLDQQTEQALRLTNRWKSGWMEWHAEARLALDPDRGDVTVGYCPSSAELLADKTFVTGFWQTFDGFAAGTR